MKRLLAVLAILSFFACSKEQDSHFNIIQQIPEDSEMILIAKDFQELHQNLGNNRIIKGLDINFIKTLVPQLAYIDQLNFTSETALSLSALDSETPVYSIITRPDSSFIKADSIKNISIETLRENKLQYKRIDLEGQKFFMYESGATSILSNSRSRLLAIAAGKGLLNSPAFSDAYKAADPAKTSLFLRAAAIKKLSPAFEEFSFPGFQNFDEWMVLDTDMYNTEIRMNGISLTGEKPSFLNLFSHMEAREIEVGKVCPQDFENFYSFSISSAEKFQSNLAAVYKDSTNIPPGIFKNIREISSVRLKEGKLFVLNSTQIEASMEYMAGMGTQTETFRNLPIYELSNPGLFKKALAPVMLLRENRFFTVLDHFIIFSGNLPVLKQSIADYLNSNVLAGKSYYSEIVSSLSSASSILLVSRLPEIPKYLQQSSTEKTGIFKKNSLAAFQIIKEDNFAHLHAIISNSEHNAANTIGAEQVASFKTDSPIATPPKFFRNHETDQMDIVVQDENNLLYLLSNKGNVFWKKKLDSEITGTIHEIDLFKNGNKQLAFSTGYHLEVLDRKANTVKPFPVKFNDALTQPLSVCDYDNNRTYRFVLTQNKQVYMIGPKGRSIKGFNFEKAATKIIKPPKHIRLGTKDYILISEESGNINILSRQGTIRVPVSEKIDYSENDWFGYDSEFVTTTRDNHLLKISQAGRLERAGLNLADNTRLIANSEHLVYFSENALHINDKVVELDYGLYNDPQLFNIGGRTYISIGDTQTQKIYVFDQNAELLPGFPVFGNSQIDMANADVDARLELIVQGEENEILLYKL